MALKQPLDLFVVAGEKSGDLLGAKILARLKDQWVIGGVTGPELEKIGVTTFFSIDAFEVIGFFSLIPHLPRIIRLFYKIKKTILEEKPKMVLLIDNAEFSLLLAKALRKASYSGKIVQLVSPSVWAWRKNRKKTMEKTLDHLFCILPFEPAYFQGSPLSASYIGHPLVDSLKTFTPTSTFKNLFKKPVIALFPGSRVKEVELTLPLQLAAIKDVEGFEIAVSVASEKVKNVIVKILDQSSIKAHLIPSKDRYDLMQLSFFSLAKFGTINLELAYFAVPTITAFPLPRLERWILQYLFKIYLPHYSLTNMIAKRRIFPEYVGLFATTENLRQEVKNFIENEEVRESCKRGCQEVKNHLESALSLRVAEEKILSLI